jgi:hypothetical protein
MQPPQPSFSATFRAFLKEATFTRQVLGAGATQVRDANYAAQGQYFLAFTSLSTGLERIGKMCLMIDHFLDHGQFPSQGQMRREIGHQISLIYEKTASIVAARGLALSFLKDLQDPIHASILSALSQFAEGDRYSNINLLVGSSAPGDPIALWHETVDKPIFVARVRRQRKQRILSNAANIASAMGAWSAVIHIAETGETISSLEEASVRTGVFEALAPYRQLYVVQIIRYWVEVLMCLQDRTSTGSDLPHFGEIFALFYNDDSYIRSRKTWLLNHR